MTSRGYDACLRFGSAGDLQAAQISKTEAGVVVDLADWVKDTRGVSRIVDCVDADLEPFRKSSGKLIIWHRWCDGALTPKASIEYFEKGASPAKNEFLRLYLLPGVHHCGGDPGPSVIDWLEVISDWVERNEAPNRLVVKKENDEGQVVMTRPIYPYPKYAKYKGTGDPKDADSFEQAETRPGRR